MRKNLLRVIMLTVHGKLRRSAVAILDVDSTHESAL